MSIQETSCLNNLCTDNLYSIFAKLPLSDLITCSAVSQVWRTIADLDSLWKTHLTEKKWHEQVQIKQLFIEQKRMEFISSFPKGLIEAIGGIEEAKKLPYLNLKRMIAIRNGSIQLSDVSAPLTLGRFFAVPALCLKKPETWDSKKRRYSFIAIRYINRQLNLDEESKCLNVCTILEGKLLAVINTRGEEEGFPTWFREAGIPDISRISEYIGRLVRGEACGVHSYYSNDENSKLTDDGKSTISLA